MRIGVDLLGGDTPPEELFQAVLSAASQTSHEIEVYVPEHLTSSFTAKVTGGPGLIALTPASDIITMDDDPIDSLKQKKQSSLALALHDLKQGEIDALVSVGNTGALVAGAVLSLKKIPGVTRPGLLALLPTRKGVVAVVDVGASVKTKAKQLLEFAELGSRYMEKKYAIKNPAVGLLNIGSEAVKGDPELQEAYQMLRASKLNFIGNIEGNVAFDGHADVIVTNGFSGNVFLKASEGMASFIFGESHLEPRFNYEEYPGALLIGLEKPVIKCHGNSGPKALESGILGAADALDQEIIQALVEGEEKR